MRKYLLWIVLIVVLVGGIVVGLLLVQQQQVFKQKASVPTGTATLSIQPATATFERGATNPVTLYFNTHGILISEIKVRLTYSNLGLSASGIDTSALTSSGDWTCPVKTISTSGSTDQIDIVCSNSSATGYSNDSDTAFATFNFVASAVPIQNPVIVSYDAAATTVTQKSDGSDIALTPNSTGSYTIVDSLAASPTASPVVIVASPTATPTSSSLASAATSTPTPNATQEPVSTQTPSPSPTATLLAAASPTPSPTTFTSGATILPTNPPMPVTGFDAPTMIGAAVGFGLLLVGLLAVIL